MLDQNANEQTTGIGPNALTQLFEPIKIHCGSEALDRLLENSDITTLPDMTGLVDEAPIIRFHAHLHNELPEKARIIEREAGIGTAHYILAHRIPKFAQGILKALPVRLSALLLTKAITKNAWTFTGSGKFSVASRKPLVFEVKNNPLIRGINNPGCSWHAAVFETLFKVLVSRKTKVRELCCSASEQSGCRFEITF